MALVLAACGGGSGDNPAPNQAPIARAGADRTVDERAPVQLDGSVSNDPNGAIAEYHWTQTGGPAVTLADADTAVASFTAPTATAPVALTFQLEVFDAEGASDTDDVVVTVNPVNEAPVAADDAATTAEDTPVTLEVLANDSDPDGANQIDSASITLGAVQNGTATVSSGRVNFTPAANFSGSAGFQYTVRDTTGAVSNTATATITVTAVNDPPVIAPIADQATDEDVAIARVPVSFSDPDGDSLSWNVDSDNPALLPSLAAGADAGGFFVRLEPAPDQSGLAHVTVAVSDGTAQTRFTFTVTVAPVNDAPVATDGAASGTEDTPVTGTLAASDVDSATLAFSVVAGPAHGTLAVSGNGFTYTPVADYSGADAFTFKANDGALDSNVATVQLTLAATNDAPVAADDAATTAEDQAVRIDVLANDRDVDGALDPASVTASAVEHGTLAVDAATGAITFTPAADFAGTTAFTYTVRDADGAASNAATVGITVSAVDDAPTISTIADRAIDEDASTGAIAFTVSDADDAADTLTVSAASDNATLVPASAIALGGSGADRTVTITPAADEQGSARITLTVSDGTSDSSTSFVLTVNGVNDAPQAFDESAATDEDAPVVVNVLANDVDSDSALDPASVAIRSESHGVATANAAGEVSFLPDANYFGTEAGFTYTVRDAEGAESNAATVAIVVNSVNDAPVATDASFSVDEDPASPLTGQLAASDADGDALTFELASPAQHGAAAVNADGSFSYQPQANYSGSDSFTFVARDASAASAPATVTIAVMPRDEAALSVSDATVAEDGGALTFTVMLSRRPDATMTVAYQTVDGTARAGSDYRAATGTLQFDPAGPATQIVTVPVIDDAFDENDETLTLKVAADDAAAGDFEGAGTIHDDEDSSLLRAGAARRPISPTQAQIDGLEEPRAFGAGTHLQRFNLGGFGINVGQNLPDPAGEIPAQATTTEPATRRVFTNRAGVEEHTQLRLLAVQQPGGDTVVFVMIDAIGAGNVIQAGVKSAIIDAAEAQGVVVLPENILFGQTHSHTAADLQGLWGGVPQDWVQNVLYAAAGDAAREAVASLRPARLKFRQGYTVDFNNYRRPRIDPNADADGTLTLLSAAGDDGTPIGSILQYNAHPTSVGDDNQPRTPHSEYVLGAMDWIEGHEGGTALYFNGPIADASPSGSRPGCVNAEIGSGDPSGAEFGSVRCRGEGIADYLLDPQHVIASGELEPTLSARSTQVVLPITNPAFLAAAGAGSFNRYYNFTELPTGAIPGLTPEQAADLPQVAPVAVTTVSRVTLGGAEHGLEIVTIPGETTNTMGNYIRGLARSRVMLMGLTHNSFGYILPEEEFSYVDQQGDAGFVLPFTGYEENVSLGPLTAPLLRTEGYNVLFDVAPATNVPPALTACLDGTLSPTCVLTVAANRVNLLVSTLGGYLGGVTGPIADACRAAGGPAEFCDALGGVGTTTVLDARLVAASADAEARGCDLLDTSNCLLPFPSDHFTVPAAAGSPQGTGNGGTGKRINFNILAMPRNAAGKPIDPTEWNRNDGFSPGQLIVTYVPGIGAVKGPDGKPLGPITGAVPITDLPRYADADAPILVLDADTGERHPIWAEINLDAGYLLPMQGFGPRADKKAALLIRPAKNFLEGHRYVVVLRHLENDYGQPIHAGPAFTACRDHSVAQLAAMPTVQARCAELAENVFPVLDDAGIARDASLYLAWDFTVASAHNDVGRLKAMRDDAFGNYLGEGAHAPNPGEPGYPAGRAPSYKVLEVIENPDDKTVRRIRGTLTVPSYVVPADPSALDANKDFFDFRQSLRENNADLLEMVRQQCASSPVDDADPVGVICDLFDPGTAAAASLPPNRLNYVPDATSAAACDPDADQLAGGCALQARYGDGLPDRNPAGDLTTVFTCNIPRSAVSGAAAMDQATADDVKPVRPTLYGHGLLGGHGEGNGQASDFGNRYGFMTCATDWFGFASGDVPNVASALVDLSNFAVIPDGTQQGILNQLFLARLAVHPQGLAADPLFQVDGKPVFDRREVFYHGNSQGGIVGGAVVAASKDVNRGVLGVPGMNYSTLLSRSTDFGIYSVPLYLSYQDDLERPFIMSLMQMLWDRSENNGYAEHITDNAAFEGPDNEVLLQPAFGDHQVTMWSADVMARTVGARVDARRVDPARHPDRDGAEYALLEPLDYANPEHAKGSALVPFDEQWLRFDGDRCNANSHTDAPPIGNVPPNRSNLGAGAPLEDPSIEADAGGDPHECPRRDPQARCQMSHFLQRTANVAPGDTSAALVDPAQASRVYDDYAHGCPAVVTTGAPGAGEPPVVQPSLIELVVAAVSEFIERLGSGDVPGALAVLQGAAEQVVAEATGFVEGLVGGDETGPEGIWLAGDMHVHDDHSSDGSGMRQTVGQGSPGTTSVADQIAFAESQGLDFLPLTDHRTFDQHYDPQWRSSGLLLITGEEANSSPHANVFGAVDMITQADNPAGAPEFRKLQQSIWDAHAQGAAWSTNHPDDGEVVTYPEKDADDRDLPKGGNPVLDEHGGITPDPDAFATGIDLVEVWNRGTLNGPKIAFAENRWNAGYRFGVAGASDNHFRELWAAAGPGAPTTHVLASERSTPALLDGMKHGRTVINRTAAATFVTLTGDFDGDGTFETVGGDERTLEPGRSVTLRVSIANGAGTTVSVYRMPGKYAGAPAFGTFTPTQPQEHFDFTVTADAQRAQDWYRVEVRGPGDPDAAAYQEPGRCASLVTWPPNAAPCRPQDAVEGDPTTTLRAISSPIFISTAELARPASPDLPADNGGAPEPVPALALFGSDADNAFAGFADLAEADGVVHAVAEVRSGGRSQVLYRARLADGTLTQPFDLSPDSGLARQPAVAAAGRHVWVAFQDQRTGELPHNPQVFVRHSADGGASWDDEQQLSASAARAQHPDLALLDAATPVVVWEDNTGGAFDVYARIVGRDAAPVNLSAVNKTVTPGNGVDSRSAYYPASVSPKVAVRADGAIAVAWQDNRFDVDPGWTGHMIDPTDPDQVAASARKPGFIEQGTETDDWEILAATFDGSAWSAPVNVSNSPDQADRHATVAFAADGTLHAAWDSKLARPAGPRLEIRASRRTGTTWSAPQAVAKDASYSSQRPVLGADAGGLSLLWTDGRSADWRWRVRRANLAGAGWTDAGFVTGPGNGTWPSYGNGWLAFTSDRNATREQRKPHQVFLLPLAAAEPPADADGDGVPDASDQCPNEAGPADNAGCPVVVPPDGDGDGVPDATDQCPDEAGPASNNGCPVVTPTDTDGDGVPDATDECPNQPGPSASNGCPAPSADHASCGTRQNLAGGDNYQQTLTSESGYTISFQVMEPKDVDCTARHPLILQGHGFGGHRATDRTEDAVRSYLEAGFAVISIDQRGFGDSNGTVRVMDPDYEGKDLVRILDWAEANLDYLAYRDGNLLVGAVGGSYGGGYQFLLHNVDPKNRLDALAPDVTWHDLRYSLNPGDTLKSAFGLLLSAGGEKGSYQPAAENGENPADRGLDPYIVEVLTRAIASGEFPREALDWFNYHSPSYWCALNDQPAMPYAAAANAPLDPNMMLGTLAGEGGGANARTGQPAVDVFISQGFRDTLFNVNDAWWNYQCAKARGGDVRLITHQAGHILNPASLINDQIPSGTPLDIQAPPGSGNCGTLPAGAARVEWFKQKLRGKPAGSAVARTEDGLCISLAEDDAVTIPAAEFLAPKDPRTGIPQGRTSFHPMHVGAASVPNGVLAQQLYLAGQPPAVTPLLEVTADAGLIVAGLPHATLKVTTPAGVNDAACAAAPFSVPTLRTGCDSITLVGLGVLRTGQTQWTLLDDQLTPVRGLGTHTLDFAGVAERLRQGDQLGLLVYGYHPQYLGSYSRDPSIPVVNVDAQLQLPLYAVGAGNAPDFDADPATSLRPLDVERASDCTNPGNGMVTPECLATGSAAEMLRTVCDYQWIPTVCAFDQLGAEGRGSQYAVGDDPHPGQPLVQVAGAVHNHSGYSDGDPSAIPADYFRAARIGHNVSDDSQRDTGVKLDFMLGSEHSDNEKLAVTTAAVCVGAGERLAAAMQQGFEDQSPQPVIDWIPGALSPTTVVDLLSCSNVTGDDHYFKWQATLEQAIAGTERDGAAYSGFTAMRGFEYTNDYYNHLNVYLSSNVVNVKNDGSYADLGVFWDWLREPVEQGGGADALVTFNHPGGNPHLSPFDGSAPTGALLQAVKPGANWNDVAYVDAQIDERVFGMEVNGGDDIEFFVKGLTHGWHLSPLANEDEHQREWATSDEGKTLVYVRGRSPQDYYHALKNRRTAAVHNALVNGAPGTKVQVPSIRYWADGADFQSGQPLGSIVEGAGEHTLRVEIAGLAQEAKVALIGRTGGAQAAPIALGTSSGGAFSATQAITAPATGEDWYFVVLCPASVAVCDADANGYFGVTAPIWFKAAGGTNSGDEDGDGVPDQADACLYQPGASDNGGCPVASLPLCLGDYCLADLGEQGQMLQDLVDQVYVALVGEATPLPPQGVFMVGTGEADHTPKGRTCIGGGSTNCGRAADPSADAQAVRDPLVSKATAITGANGETFIVVTTTNIGYFLAYKAEQSGLNGIYDVRLRIAQATGVPSANVTVVSDHSHNGPDTIGIWGGVSAEYMKITADAVVTAAVQAFESRRPAVIKVAAINQNDRREPGVRGLDSSYDLPPGNDLARGNPYNEFRLLVADDAATGERILTFVNYAPHATVTNGDQFDGKYRLTGDWAAWLPQEAEAEYGGMGLATVGALGSTDWNKTGDIAGKEAEARDRLRTLLAAATARLEPVRGAGVQVESTFIREPLAQPALLLNYKPGVDRNDPRVPSDGFDVRIDRSVLPPFLTGSVVGTYVSAARIGDVFFSTFPGEPFGELNHALKDEGRVQGARVQFLLGGANDFFGYMVKDPATYEQTARTGFHYLPGCTDESDDVETTLGVRPEGEGACSDHWTLMVSPTIGSHIVCTLQDQADRLGFVTANRDAECPVLTALDGLAGPPESGDPGAMATLEARQQAVEQARALAEQCRGTEAPAEVCDALAEGARQADTYLGAGDNGGEPPASADGGSLAACVLNQDAAQCQGALERLPGLQECSFDESGINCAYEVVHDAIGVDTAANFLRGLVAQCDDSPANPACDAIRSIADGSDAAGLAVANRPIPRGHLTYTEAPAATPWAKTVDGAIDDWMAQGTRIGGTDIYEFGEHVYTDFLFDAFGADDGDDARRWATLLLLGEASSRTERIDALQQAAGDQLGVPAPAGTTADHYGDAADREDGTDLTEVRWAANGTDVYFLARVARLQDPANLVVVILADTDDAVAGMKGLDAGLTTAKFDRAVVLRNGSARAINLVTGAVAEAGTAVASAAGYDNALEARLPGALLQRPDGTLRVAVFTALERDGRLVPANVAYRDDEPVTIYSERAQALALFAGNIDRFDRDISVQALSSGYTRTARPAFGYHERQFISGANISRESETEDGRLQPYGVFVPSAPAVNVPGNDVRLTFWTHYRGGKTHSGAAWTPQLFWQLGEEQGNVVVSPRGRHDASWYTTRAHQDFFEVFADVAGTSLLHQYAEENLPAGHGFAAQGLFAVDPTRVYISGYSMGGFATYLFSGLYPDLFAAGYSTSGAVTQGAWTGLGPDASYCGEPSGDFDGDPATACFIEANDGRANAQLNYRILDNTRYVPLAIHHGSNDELALTPGALRMGERLAELQYRYDATTFLGYEHFTQAIMDEWRDGAVFLNQHERPQNPRTVTYKVVPALVEAVNEVQLKDWNGGQPFTFNPDGAYWVDGLVVREAARVGDNFDPAASGRIDVTSEAIAAMDHVAVPRSGTYEHVNGDRGNPYASTPVFSPANHSTPYVRHGLEWRDTGPAPLANRFTATLTNLSAARLDTARMELDFTTDVEAVVTIAQSGGSAVSLTLDGAPAGLCVENRSGKVSYDGATRALSLVGDGTHELVIRPGCELFRAALNRFVEKADANGTIVESTGETVSPGFVGSSLSLVAVPAGGVAIPPERFNVRFEHRFLDCADFRQARATVQWRTPSGGATALRGAAGAAPDQWQTFDYRAAYVELGEPANAMALAQINLIEEGSPAEGCRMQLRNVQVYDGDAVVYSRYLSGDPPPAGPGLADVCEAFGIGGSEALCGQLREAQQQLRAACEADAGALPASACGVTGGDLHALVDACYDGTGGNSAERRDGQPLAACRIVDGVVTGIAAYCRQAVTAAQDAPPPQACALLGGVQVGEHEMQAYENGWVHKALRLQNRLGYDLPLVHTSVVATHNSFNATDDNTPPTLSGSDSNQLYTMADQLRMGVRSLEIDVHWMPRRSADGTTLREPVVCHGTELEGVPHVGCTSEKPLRQVLAELRPWLDANPHEAVVVYIEDNLRHSGDDFDAAISGDAYEAAGRVVDEELGDIVWKPAATPGAAACQDTGGTFGQPGSWLNVSRGQMVAAGKQLLLIADSCSDGAGASWDAVMHWKHTGTNVLQGGSHRDGARYPDRCIYSRAQYATAFTRVWEDSTMVTASDVQDFPDVDATDKDGPITPAIARELMRCGMHMPGLDQLAPADGRLEAMVWSWAPGEPSADAGKDCALHAADGRLVAAACPAGSDPRKYACVDPADPARWTFANAPNACARYSVPANGYANEQLKEAKAAAGLAEVWVNYRRDAAAFEGWVSDHDASGAGTPRTAEGEDDLLSLLAGWLDELVSALQGLGDAVAVAAGELVGGDGQGAFNALVNGAAQLVADVTDALAEQLPGGGRTFASDCSEQSWIGGTTEICDGVLTYRDYVYDDHGADTQASYNTGAGASASAPPNGYLGPVAGDERYASGQENTADFVKLTLAVRGGQLHIAAELNTLYPTSGTKVAVALDTDDDATTGGGAWTDGIDAVQVSSAGWDVIHFLPDADDAANTLTGSFPLPAGSTWRVQAVAAQANGRVMNVAFRGTEEEAKGLSRAGVVSGTWWEDKQAAVLATGDISAFGHAVEVADLVRGATRFDEIRAGLHQRVYTSRYTLADGSGPTKQGEGISVAGVAGREAKNNYPCEQLFHFLGKYQPYGIYIPSEGNEASGQYGLQLLMHGCAANHASLVNQRGMQLRFGEELNRILVVPLGRGPVGFYSGISERDVLDVMDDVQAHYAVDADRVVSGGYSMGGYGSIRLAALYPDRFAGAVNWVGFTGDILNLPFLANPAAAYTNSGGFANSSTGADLNLIDYIVNLQHVPSTNLYAGADELVGVHTATAMMEQFIQTEVPFRWYLHPTADHLTFAVLDDWRKEAADSAGWTRARNPARVVYQVDDAFDYTAERTPDYGIRHDAAYWVSALRRRAGTTGRMAVDLTTTACPDATTPVLDGSWTQGLDPVPWYEEKYVQTGSTPLAQTFVLSGSTSRVASLTIDLASACLTRDRFAYDIETDGPLTIAFSDGSAPLVLPAAGRHTGGQAPPPADSDGDGVGDPADACEGTPTGTVVDARGCPVNAADPDGDGVATAADACAATPGNMVVDARGCSAAQRDSDGDGLYDGDDNCPVTVNPAQQDTDGDGTGDACAALGRHRPTVVVAVADSGVNPYHKIYYRPDLTEHPCTYVKGFDDCSIEALNLSIGQYATWQEAFEADRAIWEGVQPHKWYWIPKTNIIGAVCADPSGGGAAGQALNTVDPKLLCILDDSSDHGTGTSSSVLMESPDAVLLIHEGNSGAVDLATAPVTPDVQSHSWGPPAPLPLHAFGGVVSPDPQDCVSGQASADTLFFLAAGNEALFPVLADYTRFCPSSIVIGGGTSEAGEVGSWTFYDFASWYCRPGALTQRLDGYGEYCGTSFAAPTAAGTAAAALLEIRRAEGYVGRSSRSAVSPGVTREAFLDALRKAATYAPAATYPNSNGYAPLPLVPGREYLVWGWGFVDRQIVPDLVACARGLGCPAKSAEATQWNSARDELRREGWELLSGSSLPPLP